MPLSKKQLSTLTRIAEGNAPSMKTADMSRLFQAAGAVASDEGGRTVLTFGDKTIMPFNSAVGGRRRSRSSTPVALGQQVTNFAQLLLDAQPKTNP